MLYSQANLMTGSFRQEFVSVISNISARIYTYTHHTPAILSSIKLKFEVIFYYYYYFYIFKLLFSGAGGTNVKLSTPQQLLQEPSLLDAHIMPSTKRLRAHLCSCIPGAGRSHKSIATTAVITQHPFTTLRVHFLFNCRISWVLELCFWLHCKE